MHDVCGNEIVCGTDDVIGEIPSGMDVVMTTLVMCQVMPSRYHLNKRNKWMMTMMMIFRTWKRSRLAERIT